MAAETASQNQARTYVLWWCRAEFLPLYLVHKSCSHHRVASFSHYKTLRCRGASHSRTRNDVGAAGPFSSVFIKTSTSADHGSPAVLDMDLHNDAPRGEAVGADPHQPHAQCCCRRSPASVPPAHRHSSASTHHLRQGPYGTPRPQLPPWIGYEYIRPSLAQWFPTFSGLRHHCQTFQKFTAPLLENLNSNLSVFY
ncbi:uncharacterized protein LOC143034468 [Oratosquilla oratoria]|uniref:uncharacterized protein LOC143034468 n=1 Tax=Oratosquilla oratoria TaxID=337810 RepID=UPI003F776B94